MSHVLQICNLSIKLLKIEVSWVILFTNSELNLKAIFRSGCVEFLSNGRVGSYVHDLSDDGCPVHSLTLKLLKQE